MTKIVWKITRNLPEELHINVDRLPAGDTEIDCPNCFREAHIHNTQRNIFISCCYCDLSGIGGKIIEP